MIVVHVPCDERTMPYAQYAFSAMERLATTGDQLVLRTIAVSSEKQPRYQPATNHATAIGKAFAAVPQDPEAIHIICDSDTVVVRKGWDRTVKDVLEQATCVGTTYAPKGGRNAGVTPLQTYKDRPHPAWLALRPGEPWEKYVPRQDDTVQKPILTDEDVEVFGLPRGHYLLQDTCWDFPLFLYENRLTYMTMDNVEDFKALQGLPGSHEEWWFDGDPFVVHQGKSRKNAFRDTAYSKAFYERCDRLLASI